MLQKWITSIGLDIGTSTTKLIVSKLLIANQQNQFMLPGCQIVDRHVAYASSIYTTPMLNDVEIDVQRLTVLLEKEYKKAGISLDQVRRVLSSSQEKLLGSKMQKVSFTI
jgi:ethanolamine utilization protein EutA